MTTATTTGFGLDTNTGYYQKQTYYDNSNGNITASATQIPASGTFTVNYYVQSDGSESYNHPSNNSATYMADTYQVNDHTKTDTVYTTSYQTYSGYNTSTKLLSSDIIPYMRSIPIRFELNSFRPFTRLYPFWDNINVSDCCTPNGGNLGDPIITDAAGHASGTYVVPNRPDKKFVTGTSVFKFTDSATNSDDANAVFTSGQTNFVSNGILNTFQNTYTYYSYTVAKTTASQVTSTYKTVDLVDSQKYVDPIAQTFMIPDVGGAFVTKVAIFFSSKAKAIPVTLQLRTVENGTPTGQIIATKTITPDQVSVSANASAATYFTFDQPILLSDTQEYAIVLISDTQEYNVYICQLGENVIGQNASVAKQPNLGVFLTSSNASTWTPNQTQDLKFTIYKAQFSTTDEQVTFTSEAPTAQPLFLNSIYVTSGSNTVYLRIPSHGLIIGDTFSLSGVVNNPSLIATDFNKTWTVVDRTIDVVTITVPDTAIGTGSMGGSQIAAVVNYPISLIKPFFNTYVPSNGNIKWEYKYKLQSNRTVTDWTVFDPSSPINLNNEGVCIGAGDIQVRATLQATSPNLTPVIGKSGAIMGLNSFRVNSDSTKPAFVYVTKPIKFNNPNTSSRFWIDALLPSGSNLYFYYKAIDNSDQDMSQVAWTQLQPTKPIQNDSSNFVEYEFDLNNIGSFVGYLVKIVLTSDNRCNPPRLGSFRSVALA